MHRHIPTLSPVQWQGERRKKQQDSQTTIQQRLQQPPELKPIPSMNGSVQPPRDEIQNPLPQPSSSSSSQQLVSLVADRKRGAKGRFERDPNKPYSEAEKRILDKRRRIYGVRPRRRKKSAPITVFSLRTLFRLCFPKGIPSEDQHQMKQRKF